MISRIARKEFVEMLRDGRFRILALAVVALSLLSLAAGWKTYLDLSHQHAAAQAATRAQWLAQDKKNPHQAAHYGIYAFQPKSQLAMIDTGIDPYMGVAVWLEAHKQDDFKYRPAQDRTAVQRFGEMNGAEVLQVLLPLFIVLMTFSSFAGERDQGTLRQLLSLGVSRRQLALGKTLGVSAALGLILAPATVFGVTALTLSSSDGLLAGDPGRAAWLGGTYFIYFAILISLGLGVSARARSSRLALVALITFWFGNSLVATRAVSDLAAVLYPTPSTIEFQKSLDADINKPGEMERRLNERRAELFKRYNVTTVDALPIAFAGVSLQEGENHGNEVFDQHFGDLFDRFEQQNRVYQIGGVIAPMLAVRSVSMGLAGTDFQQHRHFATAAEQYRRGIQRVMNQDIMANPTNGTYFADDRLWSKVPEFEYAAPSTTWVLRNYRSSALVLVLWLVAATMFMLRSAARVTVA